jgi:outer membrane protein assembly factor BamB
MNKTLFSVILVGLLCALTTLSAQSAPTDAYWPTWRGPDATGAAPTGNPPITWSENENVKWKVKLPGTGSSSPIIWGDKLFFQVAIDTGKKSTAVDNAEAEKSWHGGRAADTLYQFDLVCMDKNSGAILWQKTAVEAKPHEGHHPDHGYASYSPVTDGKLVWANFGSNGVHCYDVNGAHQWSIKIAKMRTRAEFGEGGSLVIAGDAAVVLMDQEDQSYILALDKKTGKTLWREDRDEQTSWSTPIAVEVDGVLQVIVNASNFVRSYNAKTGDVIWQCSGQTSNAIPSPVSSNGTVYCTSGFRGSALQAIALGRTGDLSGSDAIQWQVNEGTPYVPSPLLMGDKIYVYNGNKAALSCYQASTGKAIFVKQALEGLGNVYASPVGAAGQIYCVDREGKTQVIKEGYTFQVLATNTLDDKMDASPAIAGSQLFLKGKTYLYCIAAS